VSYIKYIFFENIIQTARKSFTFIRLERNPTADRIAPRETVVASYDQLQLRHWNVVVYNASAHNNNKAVIAGR